MTNKFIMTFRIASFPSTSTLAPVGATSAGTTTNTIQSILPREEERIACRSETVT